MFGNQQRFGFYKVSYEENEDGDASSQNASNDLHDGDGDMNRTNLIVNYLPQYMTEKDLYTMFVSQGPIDNVRIMKDFKTEYSYGFGFVKFVNPEDAQQAIHALNGIEYYNKRLKVSYARPPGQDIKYSNLYVTNLPRNITEEDIENMFGEYGVIVQKNILKDKITRMPRDVAFVRYARREDAQNAITGLNGKFLDGCMEPLTVKVAEKHGRQKAIYFKGWKAGYQLNKDRPDTYVEQRCFRQMRGGEGFPRRGMSPHRGNFNGNVRGNHRYNPMGAGGDMGFPMMNTF